MVVVADEFVVAGADGAFEGDAVGEVPDHGVSDGAVVVGDGILVFEVREEVAAVEVFVGGIGSAGHGEDGGVKVEAVGDGVGLGAGLDAGAGDDEGNASAAFHRRDFSAGEGVVVGVALVGSAFHAAVVGGENEVGIFAEFVAGPARVVGGVEIGEDLAEVVVELLDHGGVEGVLLARGSFGVGLGWVDAEFFGVVVEVCF